MSAGAGPADHTITIHYSLRISLLCLDLEDPKRSGKSQTVLLLLLLLFIFR